MLWVWLSALANRWLWLVAAAAGGVLWAAQVPFVLALGAALIVLVAGAGAGATTQLREARRRRGIGSSGGVDERRLPRVRDEVAASILARGLAAARRIASSASSVEHAPTTLAVDLDARSDLTLRQLHTSAVQVDRIAAALDGIDTGALHRELGAIEAALTRDPTAGPELVAERRRSADGLRAQLASVRRLQEQRTLLLERMRATAVGLEGLATRAGEVAALYSAHGAADTSEQDIGELGGDLDDLREALVDAQREVRAALSGDTLPPPADPPRPPPAAG